MKLKMNLFTYFAIAGILLFVSCDKNGAEINAKNLPEPIKIDLRSTEKEMVKSDQAFAFEFFANVFDQEATDEDKNFMISPLSLSIALAMTNNGAAGETKDAIQRTLKFGDYTDADINAYYKKLKEALLKTDPTTKLSIANAIFTNKFIAIKPNFINTNQSFYDATVQPVDFSNSATKDIINKWAADNTNNLIQKVIDKTGEDDLMYLLNAIYFKGIWTTKFEPKNTSKMPFTYENGTKKNVDMMTQTAKFNYTENQDLQMLQLPYGNQAFSMMVLLPKEGKKISDLASAAQKSGYWNNLKSGLRQAEADVFLPKFKTKYTKRLNGVLKKMGMEVPFNLRIADFSRMSDVSAFISFVQQDTYISTDEVGTEAAAVTTVGVEFTSALPTPKKVTFKADKPFIYIIQENSTGAILFMGAVKNFEE